ncbi:MAG: NAD(P)/FAD-dependent oxidoreductase [Puniceicoccales bacterium]|jgi:predicted Rossmann fold flavoprotein|nr:NAD(P)/FAD-dependent oxidoreductase [Puniceicoccales bacterium]
MIFDTAIIGAGASGLLCAKLLKGSCIVLEMTNRPARKVLISGGGRCNFTNKNISSEHYYSRNEHFCKSALAQFSWQNVVELFSAAGIAHEECEGGKLFSFDARNMVDYLSSETKIAFEIEVNRIERDGEIWVIHCPKKANFCCRNLVIATGGLSLPELGVSDFGYRFAQQLNLEIEPLAPALVRLDFPKEIQKKFKELAGISLAVSLAVGTRTIRDDVLLTHYGLSGPALLAASLWWQENKPMEINWIPGIDLRKVIESNRNRKLRTLLGNFLPRRLAEIFAEDQPTALGNMNKTEENNLIHRLTKFTFIPENTAGYSRAEVTRGGVAVRFLSSKTMEVKSCPSVYFIGEVVDVTGELGGYNLHWAWASAAAAAHAINGGYF